MGLCIGGCARRSGRPTRMSALGQKRKFSTRAHVVRFTAESRHAHAISASPLRANSGHRRLFDHLVGAIEQRTQYVETKRPSGLEIDHEFEFHGLLDGQIGRLCSIMVLRHLSCGRTTRRLPKLCGCRLPIKRVIRARIVDLVSNAADVQLCKMMIG